MTLKLLLAGEGMNELGGWDVAPPWRRHPPDPGVLEALLRRIEPEGWEIVDAVRWKDIRKFKVGGHREAETRNVLGLALMAREKGYDVLTEE
jgi:hypothetical protein